MIDNISMRCMNVDFKISDIENRVKICPTKIFKMKEISSKDSVSAIFNIYNTDVHNENEKLKNTFMTVILSQNVNGTTLKVRGSFRKWRFGNVSQLNLNKVQFRECLDRLSDLLNIDRSFLKHAKITQMEIGQTFKLGKSGYRLLTNANRHKYFKDNIVYESSRYFNAENISIIFYDKLKELLDTKKISENTYKKLSTKKCFIRCELKITKISGVDYAKEHFSTVDDLFENWELPNDFWGKQMYDVEFIDYINESMFETLASKKRNSLQQVLVAICIKFLGMERINSLISTIHHGDAQRKSRTKKSLIQLNEKLNDEGLSTKKYFKNIVEKFSKGSISKSV